MLMQMGVSAGEFAGTASRSGGLVEKLCAANNSCAQAYPHLLGWLLANHANAPIDDEASYIVPVRVDSKNGPLALTITLRTMSLPGMAGNCLISRHKMPGDLEAIVGKALTTKIEVLNKSLGG